MKMIKGWLAAIAVIGMSGCQPTAPTSKTHDILSELMGKGSFVDIKGKATNGEGGLEYYVEIGPVIHRVTDCQDESQVFQLLDREPHRVNETSLAALIIEGKRQGADLSCQMDRLPQRQDDQVTDQNIYIENDAYLFSAGDGEHFYRLNVSTSPCMYDFATTLFGLEERLINEVYGRPENLQADKVVELLCKDNSQSVYDLYIVPSNNPYFNEILVLAYNYDDNGSSRTTFVPFWKIDGVKVGDNPDKRDRLIEKLRSQYQIIFGI